MTKKQTRSHKVWLSFKWSVRWFRLCLAWYIIGLTTMGTFVAVIVGNWWIVPLYLFALDVASGRVIQAEAALDRSGLVINVPGMKLFQSKLRNYHEWKASQKAGNGKATSAS